MSGPAPAGPVSWRAEGRVALVTIDNPPVNAASHAVRDGLAAAIAAIGGSPDMDAAVIACAGRTFVAGADITEFGRPRRPPILAEVCAAIEACPKPVVAAIHGTALGGGLEIALASHARVASADARMGLPEVKLGIIPGAGGTQHLPRLVGIARAIEMVSGGRPIGAADALAAGLVDEVATGDVTEAALALARRLSGTPPRRTGDLPVPSFDRAEAQLAVATADRKARGQTAPGEAARSVLMAADLPFAAGQAQERATVMRLDTSDQARALRHLFFAERTAGKIPGLDGVSAPPIRTVGVVGAGTMGAGIATILADAGYAVTVAETGEAAAEAGAARIAGLYDRAETAGRVQPDERRARHGRIRVTHDLSDLAPADLVIEAVFDELDVKRDLLRRLGAVLRPDAVVATNTSYLDPDVLAEALPDPSRLIGLHFFSPPTVMRLVELVRAGRSAPDALAAGLAVAKRLGKLAVPTGVCEGFIGNRLFATWRRQCEFLLEDGALPHEVDAALEAFGFAMGPFAVFDLAGLDIAWARRKREAPTRDPAARYVAVADRLCEAGRLGQKTGAGWYAYEAGRRRPDPAVAALIEAESAGKGIVRRAVPADEIVGRVLAAIVNEAARILDEGVATRGSDIDLVLVNGYGFPAWRGGALFEADRVGLPAILAEVRRTEARDGPGWAAAPLLVRLAETGGRLSDYAAPGT